jgi:hypothetical protein
MINSFCDLFKHTNVIGSLLESSFVLVAVSVILLSIISFHLQFTGATPASSTNQPNATVGLSPPFTKLFQNSTGDINATTLSQKQELISSHIRQHQPNSIQSQQNQPMPLSYPPLIQQLPPQHQPLLSQSQQLPPQQQQQLPPQQQQQLPPQQQQQLPPQQQQKPLSQPQTPMQQQHGILPEGRCYSHHH